MKADLRVCAVQLEFDEHTGLLAAIWLDGDERSRVPITMRVAAIIGGSEERGPLGGLEYVDAARLVGSRVRQGPTTATVDDGRLICVTTDLEGWLLEWSWTIRTGTRPSVTASVEIQPPERSSMPLRDLIIDLAIVAQDAAPWLVTAPGNHLRRGVPVMDLPARTTVEPPGGSRGSSGIIHLESPEGLSLVVWCLSRTELASISLRPLDAATPGLGVEIATGLAAQLATGDRLQYEGLQIDLSRSTWPQIRDSIAEWFAGAGITSPSDTPTWVSRAMIYEVFIGWAPFWGGHRYGPYPAVSDLMADLDRIQQLGHDTIQLMPRHPYPSYNVHDYDDITTTYGPEQQLIELVAECHRRGMRVILDLLMHGVIDQASITNAATRVRTGPYRDLLETDPGDLFAADASESWRYAVSWSRHILDFEQAWMSSSPPIAPLTLEKPEWFARDSAGRITGVYTNAFDATHAGFQEWFLERVLELARRLDLDGFRLDAPTYNQFANWSPGAKHRAGAMVLACLDLFRRLRPVMREWKPDFLLYTEPSGILHRESMDLTYNYDEQFLVGSGLGRYRSAGRDRSGVRDAQDLVEWLDDRDALLPSGALTCHHLDSHDTFWWPSWGSKWRREQFGIDGVRAMTAVFMLCGGPYMTFVGGEEGIEDTLADLSRLRRELPVLTDGSTDYRSVRVESRSIVCFLRRSGLNWALVAVNVTAEAVAARLTSADQDLQNPVVKHHSSNSGSSFTRATADRPAELVLAPFSYLIITN